MVVFFALKTEIQTPAAPCGTTLAPILAENPWNVNVIHALKHMVYNQIGVSTRLMS